MPKIFIAILLCVLAVVAAWNFAYPTQSLRYKITVNIETPEGLKSGSAVRQVTMRPQPLLPQGGAVFDVIGEAVVVDLGARGKLFAVMGTDDHWMFFEAFAPPRPSGAGIATTKKGMKYYKSIKEKKVLDPKLWPLFVAFKDINDPKTVTVAYKVIRAEIREDTGLKVKAVGAEDRMVELFGEGVYLRSVTLERTKEALNRDIEKNLPTDFWQKYQIWMKSMNISERGKYVSHFNFKSGNR